MEKTIIYYPSAKFFIKQIIFLVIFICILSLLMSRSISNCITLLIIYEISLWFIMPVKINKEVISGPNPVALLRVSIKRDNAQMEQAYFAKKPLKGVYKIFDRNIKKAIHLNIRYFKKDDIDAIAKVFDFQLAS